LKSASASVNPNETYCQLSSTKLDGLGGTERRAQLLLRDAPSRVRARPPCPIFAVLGAVAERPTAHLDAEEATSLLSIISRARVRAA
jgi:hypothetical protein